MANSAESYGSYIFSFLRNLLTIFNRGCTSLHSHQQQCMRYNCSFFPTSSSTLGFYGLLIIAILTGVRGISLWFWFAFSWWLVMLSIFSCVCWPSACLFLEKCPLRSSAHFLIVFLKVYLFLFLAALGLCCCTWPFSSCGVQGLLSNWGAYNSHFSGLFWSTDSRACSLQ